MTKDNSFNDNGDIKNEILEYSYWEHFKYAKDLALILPVEHPKRKLIEAKVNELSMELLLKSKTNTDANRKTNQKRINRIT